MKWVNFLHIYQPPTQTGEVVDQVIRESYSLIASLLARYPRMRVTLNISGSLFELLEKYGETGVIESLKPFVNEGRVELVGSAMYHPLMPLVSPELMRRQIRLNEATLKKHFGADVRLRGFFFPEMAYSPAAGAIVKELGYEWVILDEIHAESAADAGVGVTPDPDARYSVAGNGLKAVFRNNAFSKTFPPESIVTALAQSPTKIGEYLVTAHDGELYGHWHRDDKGFYEKAFTSSQIEMLTISEYLDGLEKDEEIGVRAASWESTPEELAANVPFGLWDMPGNEIQSRLWHFAHMAELIVSESSADLRFAEAREKLDRGFASCAWWWASGRKIGPFSPVSWNPTEIEKGATMLVEAVRTLGTVPPLEKASAEEAFATLKDMIWKEHWNRHPKQD